MRISQIPAEERDQLLDRMRMLRSQVVEFFVAKYDLQRWQAIDLEHRLRLEIDGDFDEEDGDFIG